ncbi:MAG: hypothetical protein JO272_15180 [Pseudonocardiales bacterium]|nr:hypothetical protein [Pseudonocardiales bacterium]
MTDSIEPPPCHSSILNDRATSQPSSASCSSPAPAITAAPAQHLLVSLGRARALLGWSPGDPAERITQSVGWRLEQPPDPLDRR